MMSIPMQQTPNKEQQVNQDQQLSNYVSADAFGRSADRVHAFDRDSGRTACGRKRVEFGAGRDANRDAIRLLVTGHRVDERPDWINCSRCRKVLGL